MRIRLKDGALHIERPARKIGISQADLDDRLGRIQGWVGNTFTPLGIHEGLDLRVRHLEKRGFRDDLNTEFINISRASHDQAQHIEALEKNLRLITSKLSETGKRLDKDFAEYDARMEALRQEAVAERDARKAAQEDAVKHRDARVTAQRTLGRLEEHLKKSEEKVAKLDISPKLDPSYWRKLKEMEDRLVYDKITKGRPPGSVKGSYGV